MPYQPCSVHRRIATKCIAYDRIGALEARAHAIAQFWDDTVPKPAYFFSICVKTLNGRFHIESGLPFARRHPKINILLEGGAWTEHRWVYGPGVRCKYLENVFEMRGQANNTTINLWGDNIIKQYNVVSRQWSAE